MDITLTIPPNSTNVLNDILKAKLLKHKELKYRESHSKFRVFLTEEQIIILMSDIRFPMFCNKAVPPINGCAAEFDGIYIYDQEFAIDVKVREVLSNIDLRDMRQETFDFITEYCASFSDNTKVFIRPTPNQSRSEIELLAWNKKEKMVKQQLIEDAKEKSQQ